jgi:hypothetical protein
MHIPAPMNHAYEQANGRRAITGPLLIAVFLFHCLLGFVLYRGRVISRWPVCDSDFVVFAAPLVFALTAYAYVLISSPWLRPRSALRYFGMTAVCLILAFLSTWAYLFVSLNNYGS